MEPRSRLQITSPAVTRAAYAPPYSMLHPNFEALTQTYTPDALQTQTTSRSRPGQDTSTTPAAQVTSGATGSPLVAAALPAPTAAPSPSGLGVAAQRQAALQQVSIRVLDAAVPGVAVTGALSPVSQNPAAAEHTPVSPQNKPALSASSLNLWMAQTRRLMRSQSVSTAAAPAADHSLPTGIDSPAAAQPQRSESLPSSPPPRQPPRMAASTHQGVHAGQQVVAHNVTLGAAASSLSPTAQLLPVKDYANAPASGLAAAASEQHQGVDSAPTSPRTLTSGVPREYRRQLLQQDSSKRRKQACMEYLKAARLETIKFLRTLIVVGMPLAV